MVSCTSRSVSFKFAMGGGDMTLCGNYVMVSHLGFQYFPETLKCHQNLPKNYQTNRRIHSDLQVFKLSHNEVKIAFIKMRKIPISEKLASQYGCHGNVKFHDHYSSTLNYSQINFRKISKVWWCLHAY